MSCPRLPAPVQIEVWSGLNFQAALRFHRVAAVEASIDGETEVPKAVRLVMGRPPFGFGSNLLSGGDFLAPGTGK